MRVRFRGEADGLPCEAFGQSFPVGEWVEVAGLALRLATNPMFDADPNDDGQAGPTVEELRAECDARGISYRSNAGVKRLLELLNG